MRIGGFSVSQARHLGISQETQRSNRKYVVSQGAEPGEYGFLTKSKGLVGVRWLLREPSQAYMDLSRNTKVWSEIGDFSGS